MKNIVVIVPTYNESGNVKALVLALAPIFKSLSSYNMQLLFVDDSSPDGTAAVVRDLMFKYKWVHILMNKRKGGLGHAYKKGMIYALDKLKADVVFEFDADLQHDPARIPAMLKAIEGDADLVLGSRYIKGGGIPSTWPWYRKFLSVMGNQYIRFMMLRLGIHDWTSGYRAIRRPVVETIVPQMQNSAFNGYAWQIGFLVKSIQSGFRVAEVPYVFRDRTIGASKLGPEYIVNTMKYIMRVRITEILENRIFKFVVVGGVGALVQFTFLYLYRKVMPFQLAFFLSIETSIVSNFIWSNIWTFSDRKLKAIQVPAKFIQFNLASGGSILIQQGIAIVGQLTIGLHPLFTVPVIHLAVDTGVMYAVVGIFVGMFWNFFAYSRIIWKSHGPERINDPELRQGSRGKK